MDISIIKTILCHAFCHYLVEEVTPELKCTALYITASKEANPNSAPKTQFNNVGMDKGKEYW